MLDFAALVLATGVKGYLQDPAYVLGVPLVLIGGLALMLAMSPIELRWPTPIRESDLPVLDDAPEGHPDAAEYIKIGLFLAAVTALEVVLYYLDMADGVLLGLLLALSAGKFVIVAMWFMHLKFDNRLFSIMFTGGLILVLGLFTIVLATLGSSLV